jgi:hypothetical protein
MAVSERLAKGKRQQVCTDQRLEKPVKLPLNHYIEEIQKTS